MNRALWTGLLGITLLAFGCSNQRAVHMIKASGDRAMEQGNYELAVTEYREVLQQRPGRFEAHKDLGRALLQNGQADEARDQLEVAHTLQPRDQDTINLLSLAMLESGAFDDMKRFLTDLANAEPSAASWMRVGMFMAQAGDLDEAKVAFLTAARLDQGRSIEPQMALARIFQKAGDDEAALERLRMALYIDPQNQEVLRAIRSYGEIPGPSYALPPAELAEVSGR